MQWLKQSTAATAIVGPFVADTDGVTPVTFLATDADALELFKQGSTTEFALDSDALTVTTNATAFAELSLGTTDVDTLGMLTFVAQDASLCLPVMARFMVVEAGAYGAQITGTDAAFLTASDVQAELVTYDALKGTEGAWSSDIDALENLAASDIQAELVTYDAATGTEFATLNNLAASDIQAEIVTYDPIKGTEGAWASDIVALNDIASSDVQAELVTYDAATGTEFATLNNLASSDIQAELVTYDAATGTEIASIPTTNLDSSDIQAELVTYDAATGTEFATLNNLASSDIQAELVTYDAATGTEFATLNNLAASDVAAELATYDAATGTELAALNDLADTDVLGYTLETGYTVAQALKLIGSALAGKVSGGGTATIVFRDLADGANRITATVDSDGNRSAMTLNP